MSDRSEIIKAICAVMAGVSAVKKDGKNDFQKYKYAKAEDVLHSLKSLMAEKGLYIHHTEVRQSENDGGVLTIWFEFTIYHTSGASMPPTTQCGMASCRNSKGGFDDKAGSKCLTAAMKYFLINTFKIPTGDHDDADNDDVEKNQRAATKAQARKPDPAPAGTPAERITAALASSGDIFKILDHAKFTAEFDAMSPQDKVTVLNAAVEKAAHQQELGKLWGHPAFETGSKLPDEYWSQIQTAFTAKAQSLLVEAA